VAEWSAERRADGTWRVAGPDGSWRHAHAVTDAEDAVWVHLGDAVVVIPTERSVARRTPIQGHATLEAPMPALVTAVLANVGDVVEAGATLLLLEAMKMELPLKAPTAGRITAVHCAVGQRVTPGKALVDLSPAPGAP